MVTSSDYFLFVANSSSQNDTKQMSNQLLVNKESPSVKMDLWRGQVGESKGDVSLEDEIESNKAWEEATE
jgi:hypothetical protein